MVELNFVFRGANSISASLVVIVVGNFDFSVNSFGNPIITPLDEESKIYVDRECSDSRWERYFSFKVDDKRRSVISALGGNLSLYDAKGISSNRLLAMQCLVTA